MKNLEKSNFVIIYVMFGILHEILMRGFNSDHFKTGSLHHRTRYDFSVRNLMLSLKQQQC